MVILMFHHLREFRKRQILRYVTMVRQAKNLHEADYDQLYDYLKQDEKNMNASRAKRAARTHEPLVLLANHNVTLSSSHTSSPYYVTYP
ncbi:hypothetical protein Tco_0052627 [Tanacetum coccineum]